MENNKQTRNINKERKKSGFGVKDWVVIAAGTIIVIALAVFVLVRTNRRQPETVAVASPPAPTAATTESSAQSEPEASVRRIKPLDLRAAMSRGEVVVIDVRDLDSYTAGHIPGAMHIPLSYVESQVPYLPRGKGIVTYCT